MPLNKIVFYVVVFVIGCIFGFTACSVVVCARIDELEGGNDEK